MGCAHKDQAGNEFSFADERKAICDLCKENVAGVCMLTEKKHPGKAVIDHGIRRPSLKCPKGEWGSVPVSCPNCRRMIVVPEHVGICKWCVIKRDLKLRRGSLSKIKFDNDPHVVEPRPFDSDVVKNLHYFIYPRQRESTLYHLRQLRESIDQFNGKRVCCIATDNRTIEKEIRDELDELFTDVYDRRNDPARRETVGFIDSLRAMKTDDPNEVICLAHAKGQQESTGNDPTVRKWCDALYETVVRNWDQVMPAMEEGYPVSGSFKVYGGFRSSPYKWHYSGSFFWVRSASLFGKSRWDQTCRSWWGSESYVGRHWVPDEGHCLFADNAAGGSVYDRGLWERRLDNELVQWRLEREAVCV